MKKLLFVILISGLYHVSLAQGVSGGIKGGINFANQVFSVPTGTITPNGLTDFHGGIYVAAMITGKIGIQPELLYSNQGFQTGTGSNSVTARFSYLNIPVLFRYNVVPAFNLQAGPQLGVLLSEKTTIGSASADDTKDFNSTDMSFAFGAGFDVKKFNGGIRYTLGLANIAKSAPSGQSEKNNVFQIYIGLRVFGAGL